MSEARLKACPFCNFTKESWEKHKRDVPDAGPWESYAPETVKDKYGTGKWHMYCNNCGILFTFYEKTEAALVENWNTRTPDKDVEAVVKMLKETLRLGDEWNWAETENAKDVQAYLYHKMRKKIEEALARLEGGGE